MATVEQMKQDHTIEIDLTDGEGWRDSAGSYTEAVEIAHRLQREYFGEIESIVVLDYSGVEVQWS